jgi:hypothetical protein
VASVQVRLVDDFDVLRRELLAQPRLDPRAPVR